MKQKICLITAAIAMAFVFPLHDPSLLADDFASNEEYYQKLCSQYNADPSVSQTCKAFREYLSQKSEDLQNQVAQLDKNIAKIRDNMDQIQATINEQKKLIDTIDAKIAANDEAIKKIEASILQLDEDIVKTQDDINKRDTQIKNRMLSEQVSIGTNVYIEFVMGAKDLLDLVTIADGLQRITENDKSEIAALEEDRAKLNQQKEEQERLKADQEKAKRQNEEDKKIQEEAKQAQEALLAQYRKQEADLLQQVRNAQAAVSAIKDKIIAVDNVQYEASSGWIRPVQSGYVSAGTWSYPGGGFHAGMDFAASIGTAIRAPIGGVIVYANNPYASNNGYLGNYIGHPAGGGNTVHMVGTVNGTTYGISFFHMAQENFNVSAGMAVSQGTVIGGVGNSGNSSGPHLHIEVINLGSMSTQDAIARFRNSGADFAWGTGWNTTSTSCANRGAPCRERPESFFGG